MIIYFSFMIGVISSAELEASEIFEQVVENVDLCPEKFELLLGVIDEYEWLKDLARLIRETYKLIVQELEVTKLVNSAVIIYYVVVCCGRVCYVCGGQSENICSLT